MSNKGFPAHEDTRTMLKFFDEHTAEKTMSELWAMCRAPELISEFDQLRAIADGLVKCTINQAELLRSQMLEEISEADYLRKYNDNNNELWEFIERYQQLTNGETK